MKAIYRHTNIISKDWKKLVQFYEKVFGCIRVSPERNLSGKWLEKGTGVVGAELSGVQLRLPGHGDTGPTLEIFQYSKFLTVLEFNILYLYKILASSSSIPS